MDEIREKVGELSKQQQWNSSYTNLDVALHTNTEIIIIDNTNFLRKLRKPYLDIIKAHKNIGKDIKVKALIMNTKLEECIERNNKRELSHRVSEKVICDFGAKIQLPTLDEGFDEIIESR